MDAMKNSEKDNSSFPLALITGGSRRIGKAFAISLAQKGYGIILHYFESQKDAIATGLELQSFGVPVFPLQADLTKDDEIISLFTRIDLILSESLKEKFQLKILVNSAAIMKHADAANMAISDYDKTLNHIR